MKFQISKHDLVAALGPVAKALPVRPPVPVLSGVRIAAEDARVEFAGFDYDTSARVTVGADVEVPGTVIVSGRLLADIAKALPAGTIRFWVDGSRVRVEAGAAKFTLLSMPVDEYPPLPVLPGKVGDIAERVFARIVAQAVVAASKDQTLPLMTNVRVRAAGGVLSMTATDRYRLAVAEAEWGGPDFEVLVPAHVLTDVAKSLAGDVSVAVGERVVGFSSNGQTVTSGLSDGDYPPVDRLFPDDFVVRATVDRRALVDAVKRASLVAERNTPVKLTFSEEALTVDAGQGDDSQATETLAAESQDEIVTAYNPQFLLDGLNAIEGETAKFSFTEPMKPAVLTGADGFRYLLMPIRFGA